MLNPLLPRKESVSSSSMPVLSLTVVAVPFLRAMTKIRRKDIDNDLWWTVPSPLSFDR